MALFVDNMIEKCPLSFYKLDEDQKEIILNNEEKGIEIRLPYALTIDKEFDPDDYELYLLSHNNLPENAIFQLFEKSIHDRVGWIFPINALVSANHDYKDNIHFLKMAYVSYLNLVKGNINNSETKLISTPLITQSNRLTDFFNSQSVIVILHKPTLLRIRDFEFYEYLPSLYKLGYSIIYNPQKEIHQNKLSNFYDEGKNLIKKINIQQISPLIRKEGFIRKLFTEWLDFEQHPIMQFYLLYQIVELLINKVNQNEFKKIAIAISQDKEDMQELPYKLQGLAKEVTRIVVLFKKYTQVQSNELKERCLLFLDNKELADKDLPELLYKVRCFLVHNYRQIKKEQLKLITDINYYFEEVIISILNEYTEPQD